MVYGRATTYSDYYKNIDKTPGSADDEEDTIVPSRAKKDSMVVARKTAMKRRLLGKKKVGM